MEKSEVVSAVESMVEKVSTDEEITNSWSSANVPNSGIEPSEVVVNGNATAKEASKVLLGDHSYSDTSINNNESPSSDDGNKYQALIGHMNTRCRENPDFALRPCNLSDFYNLTPRICLNYSILA